MHKVKPLPGNFGKEITDLDWCARFPLLSSCWSREGGKNAFLGVLKRAQAFLTHVLCLGHKWSNLRSDTGAVFFLFHTSPQVVSRLQCLLLNPRRHHTQTMSMGSRCVCRNLLILAKPQLAPDMSFTAQLQENCQEQKRP